MFEILVSMIKEEWRIHSKLFGSAMFAMFPVLIALFSFIGSFFIPIFQMIFSIKQIEIFTHYMFVLLGLSVGSFGLFGREVMNRRFGQASLVAYSSRTLPVSERKIFLNFFVKDVIYYLLLWVFPFIVGFFFASVFLSINLLISALLLVTLTLSFLIGLSISSFLSTIYAHSPKLLVGTFFLLIILGFFFTSFFNLSLESLPSYAFFLNHSLDLVLLSFSIVIILSGVSLAFPKVDYPEIHRRFKNSFLVLSKIFRFTGYANFISKDFLDLNRSEGGMGKIIFSFIFPLAVIWAMLYIFLNFVSFANLFLIFSILLGGITSSIYNWLTEFDIFTSYSFLPVKVSSVIKSKVRSYIMINSISVGILVLIAIFANQSSFFFPGLLSFLAVASYSLAIVIYLTGLESHILLYSAKIFLQYIVSISPVMMILILLSMFNPIYLLASLILIPIAVYILNIGYKKWDKMEQLTF